MRLTNGNVMLGEFRIVSGAVMPVGDPVGGRWHI